MERRDPPWAGGERETLEGFLDFQRATLEWKVEGLTDEEARQTTAASSLTLAGLVKHLAMVEDQWFRVVLLGEEPADWWRGVDWEADRDWEFRTALDEPIDDLVALYRASCERSREAVASVESLDQRAVWGEDRPSLRWIFLHMIEETARHNGHADLLRESIDGATGE